VLPIETLYGNFTILVKFNVYYGTDLPVSCNVQSMK